ncbi:MAG: hypothetical protein DUD27_05725 [Lachnospiraceae bacterium]|uniref:Uncharacterized protein n=1 Tax=Candidatus Weimeria bifida TaxID=2599074 RepID=A0A6N7J2T9_9FIRM|nr:hypothetical protein [Candidatus Weimeria bifida]RRF96164.1 MAG: hypothetical protein DUD27_05725 [Lachnospiraceae bacterium]
MRKGFCKIASFSLAAVMAASIFSVSAFAKGTKKIDLTGDGRADTVSFVKTRDKKDPETFTSLKVKVNGKTVFNKKTNYYDVRSWLIKISKKNGFLALYTPWDNHEADYNGIYQYRKGKLNCVVNLNKCLPGYDSYTQNIKTSGKTVAATIQEDVYGLGVCTYNIKYTWKNNKFNRAGSLSDYKIAALNNKFVRKGSSVKLAASIKAQKSLSARSRTMAFNKGAKLKLGKISFKGSSAYIGLVQNGKTYWLSLKDAKKAAKVNTQMTIFTNTFMAG